MFRIIEEASEATIGYYDNPEEAIEAADAIPSGKYLVLDSEDNIIYDTNPNITYKI